MIRVLSNLHRWYPSVRVCKRVVICLFCLSVIDISVIRELLLASDMEVLTPRTGMTVIARNPQTHLVLRRDGPGKSSQVKVEKTGSTIDPVVSMGYENQSYLHFRLPLEPGMNRFIIIPGGLRFEINFRRLQADLHLKQQDQNISQFHQGEKLPEDCENCHDLDNSENIKPVGLKKQTTCVNCHQNLVDKGSIKHSTTINQQCLTCHQQSAKPWRIGFTGVKSQELCFICHTSKRSWFSSEVIHGPLHLGGCTLCHNPHGENHRYQLWAEGSMALCLGCHGDKQNLVSKKDRVPYVHGILFGQGCVACHNPHATDQKFMLHKPINKLCLGCHPRQESFSLGHPVPRHPVAGPKEHLRPGRELSCSSCHNPHGSSHKYMLVESVQGGRLCRACHEK